MRWFLILNISTFVAFKCDSAKDGLNLIWIYLDNHFVLFVPQSE